MPFFYSITHDDLLKRGEQLTEQLNQYQYWRCKYSTPVGTHLPLTLDEYCNPSLDPKILEFRNKDQVISRYQEDQHAGRQKINELPSVITVPQAWLWKVNETIITSLPQNLFVNGLLLEGMMDSWQNIANEVYNTNHALGLFLSDLVDVLDRLAMAGLLEPFFNIFEKAIADLLEEVNNYIKSTSVETIKIKQEKQFLHKIDDIREELSMIKTVLFQQEEVWKDFTNKAWPSYWPEGPDGRFKPPERPGSDDESISPKRHRQIWTKMQRPQLQFAKFKRRIAKLDADAERVERAIDRKLDLKAKHASLHEAHTMAIMSAAVFGFTIITIIFTPLSFIVTLFALPIDRFQRQQVPSVWTDQAGMYSTNYVGKWIGGYSQ